MANTFKTFLADDVANTRTLLHENIPITGTLVSEAYGDDNIKNYSHKRFQSVYDYPYLSSSANHAFDISFGTSADSAVYNDPSCVDANKKIQMYNTMAQILAGHDTTGSILKFDVDGDLTESTANVKHDDCVFFSFSRLLVKDEIKKGSVRLKVGVDDYSTPFGGVVEIGDYGAETSYLINSPAGEYGILYQDGGPVEEVGLVFYQAGIMVITASAFGDPGFSIDPTNDRTDTLIQSDIQKISDVIRHRIQNINFNNTVELNSTIYFCRINHNEFNYSSNPTYLDESKIRVKEEKTDEPISYITTVGLYSSNNELLAVAKLSEPLKKTPQNSLILRTRLDF